MPPKGANSQPKGKQPKSGGASNSAGPTWIAPKAITHTEHHHTLNHLDQVASYYAALSASSSSSGPSDTACRLQGEVVRSAKTLSRKAVIRMDTSVKRASCSKCDTVWIQGLTVSVRSRVSGPHDHVVKWRCGVCGSISRRPAPDLVPQIQEPQALAAAKDEAGADGAQRKTAEVGAKKISQRQRRRTASIKRQLSQQAESTSALRSEPRPARPSRKQRRDQRQTRMAKRDRSAATSLGVEAQAITIYTPTAADKSHATPPSEPPAPTTATPPQANLTAADAPPAAKKRRTQRPQLPHFNDRVQGSHWDDVFTKLSDADATHTHTSQALHYWHKAARSRGDHLVLTGVGKNGALGPQLP